MKKLFDRKNIVFLSLFFLSFGSFSQKARSQVVDSINYGWVVYEYQQNAKDESTKKCYIIATPHQSNSSYTAQRNPYFSITRYAKNRLEEISVYSGYEYKISSPVYLLIGNVQKQLFTNGDYAWAKNSLDDKEIISLMLNADSIKIRSDSSTGNYAIDEYEIKGLNRAYSRMKELCK